VVQASSKLGLDEYSAQRVQEREGFGYDSVRQSMPDEKNET
jgi:hypothetical protein